MKKLLALLCAAMFIVAAAGCVHKDKQPGSAEQTDAQGSAVTSPTEESGSVNVAADADESVTQQYAEAGSQAGTTRYSKITLYTTRAPSPSRLTTRPTTTERTTIRIELPDGATTKPNIPATKPKPTTTAAPTTNPLQEVTTAPSFKEPAVEYGGTLGTAADSVRIKSHTATLSNNNSVLLTLKFEILACSGQTEYIYIGYDCYDKDGKKLNTETVRCIVPVRQNQAESVAIATAPLNTAKIVFKNI